MKKATQAAQIRRRTFAALAPLLALGGALTAVALASSATVTVGSASNAMLNETVAVNGAGRTLYALSPETSHRLLCKSRACFEAWPPLTVRSIHTKLKAGSGVHGTLAILKRSNGVLQVTLRGKPLYRFSGDVGRDESGGEGIKSFGGTWHAVSAAASGASVPAPSTPTTTTPTTPSYGY